MSEAEPIEAELLRRAIQSALEDVQISMPGIVDSYDPTTQRATVIPGIRRPIYSVDDDLDAEEIPPLVSVPVRFDRSSKFSAHYRLQKGDFVHLVFQTRSPAEWRASGQVSTPGELRTHGFHAVAYPGYYPDVSPLDATDQDESIGVPGSHTSRVHFTTAGIEVGDDATKCTPVAMADTAKDRLDALVSAINGWTPVPNDGGAALKAALMSWLAGSNDFSSTNLKALKP